jgi:NitT/TauT family transport system permease protein
MAYVHSPHPFTASAAGVRSRSDWILTNQGLIITRLVIVGLVLLAWELASGTLMSKFWLSSPSAIVKTLGGWIATGTIWAHLQATLLEMGLGYVIGCTLGVFAGLLLGFAPTVSKVLMPFLGGLYCLPKVALAPLFVIMLGIDLASKVALVSITVFFLLLYSTVDGINDVDKDLIQSFRLMGATRREISQKILLPACLKWVFTGMRISVRYAFTAAILGEVIASNRGLGYLIEANAGQFNSTGVFAAILVLVVCSLTLSELLTRWERSASRHRSGL